MKPIPTLPLCWANGSASLDQIQNLLNCFLSEKHALVIYHHARHTHDPVLVLQLLKMANIIHMGRHIGVLRGDPLSSDHQIRTHGTGQCDQYLHFCGLCDGCDLLSGSFIQSLSGACGIVQSQHEGGKFMSTGNTVEGKTGWRAISLAYSNTGSILRVCSSFRNGNRKLV